MDWGIVIRIILGIFGFFIMCLFFAVAVLEYHKHKETKKWKDWVDETQKRL